jgi:uncharacterized Zn-finger protein
MPEETPLFFNELGVRSIDVGAAAFDCMGAMPPHDHPHVYLNMGAELGSLVSLLLDRIPARSCASLERNKASRLLGSWSQHKHINQHVELARLASAWADGAEVPLPPIR